MPIGSRSFWKNNQRKNILRFILNILNSLLNLLPSSIPTLLSIPINIDTFPGTGNSTNKRPMLNLSLRNIRKWGISHRNVENIVPISMITYGDRGCYGVVFEIFRNITHNSRHQFSVSVEVDCEEIVDDCSISEYFEKYCKKQTSKYHGSKEK